MSLLSLFSHEVSLHQRLLMVFLWRLSDSKFPPVSQTLLCILAKLINALVRMFSIRSLLSKSSSPYTNPFMTVPSGPRWTLGTVRNTQKLCRLNTTIENQLSLTTFVLVLYFDFRPGQKCHSKVMHRKEVTHSNGSYERKSHGRKLADEIGRGKKDSHGTLIFSLDDDQTCDIQRSSRRLSVTLNYYITQSREKSRHLQLELSTRCGKESHIRPKGLLEPLMGSS